MRKISFFVVFVGSMLGQGTVQQFRAEVPDAFGSAPGLLILAGDQLVFASESKPEASFTAPRNEIQGVTSDGDVITVQLRNPIRSTAGERNRVSLKTSDVTARSAVNTWLNITGPSAAPATAAQPNPDTSRIFQAHRDKLFGGSRGRLIVTDTELAYESIDDIQDSRRWAFRDIKEVKLQSPYKLEVKPFNGSDYTFVIEGQGMGSADYRDLVDRITQARAQPRN